MFRNATNLGAGLFFVFVACGSTARAADACLSLPQARAAYPGIYLHYRISDGGRRCWTAQRTARHRAPPPLQTSVSAPRSTVLWPSLASLAVPVDAALLTPEPATGWPRLLDVDELTGRLPSCRSAAGRRSRPPFVERWAALRCPAFQ